MKTYDVTIIGAGLAGLQCARLLARKGLRILLVDRKNALDQKIHTTGIFVRRTLVDFDIPDDCLGPPIRHVTLYSPAHRSMDFVSEHDEFRVGRMGQLYQRYLQQCLLSGVQWLPETSYLGHSSTNGKLTVRLSGGTFSTRYLIGADGARSRVARDLQLDQNREWIGGVESIYEGAAIDGPPRLLCFFSRARTRPRLHRLYCSRRRRTASGRRPLSRALRSVNSTREIPRTCGQHRR